MASMTCCSALRTRVPLSPLLVLRGRGLRSTMIRPLTWRASLPGPKGEAVVVYGRAAGYASGINVTTPLNLLVSRLQVFSLRFFCLASLLLSGAGLCLTSWLQVEDLGTAGFRIVGAAEDSKAGRSVSGAGDVNGTILPVSQCHVCGARASCKRSSRTLIRGWWQAMGWQT
eukprot:718044-Rhodomonas_salina.2